MGHESSQTMPLFRASPEVVLLELNNETLVYHRARSRLYVLNPSAAAILKLCNGERAEGEIARQLEQGFQGADGVDIDRDVHRTVDELVDLGIVTRS